MFVTSVQVAPGPRHVARVDAGECVFREELDGAVGPGPARPFPRSPLDGLPFRSRATSTHQIAVRVTHVGG